MSVSHHAGQHLVADGMPIRVVDILEMVQVHEGDAALLHVASGQLAPLAQRGQHLDATVGSGQRVAVTQRPRDSHVATNPVPGADARGR